MLDNVEIRVTPQQLLTKADEVSKKVDSLKRAFDQMEVLVNGTQTYWKGEAGDAHREIYKSEKETIEAMIKRLSEHPADLRVIAQNYMNVESAVTSMAVELPGDVIV